MIDYDQEIQKFKPSLVIDEAEETILKNDMTDVADVIEMLTNPKGAVKR